VNDYKRGMNNIGLMQKRESVERKCKMYRAYIYPNSARRSGGSANPYLKNFVSSLSNRVEFLNKNNKSSVGILDLLRYLGRIEFLFLHWIEDVPEKKGGYIQSLLLLLMMFWIGRSGFKIVWTMHNKVSHSRKHFFMKKRLFKALLRKSDLIITHSSEGACYACESEPSVDGQKILVFTHPIVPKERNPSRQKEYDILIWGTLAPYKGVHNFLSFLEENRISEKYRIKIIGRCSSDDYCEVLSRKKSQYVSIEDRFVEHSELDELMASTRCVLFTYSGESVLSSGALMDSLACRTNIIGPDVGAFRDAALAGVIKTYKSFDEIPEIINSLPDKCQEDLARHINEFINAHTWEKFGEAVISKLSSMSKGPV
jgi:beta-1,4-mannosyltransferase